MNKRDHDTSWHGGYPPSTFYGVSSDIERVVQDSEDLSLEEQAKIVIELHAASMKIENRLRGLNGNSI